MGENEPQQKVVHMSLELKDFRGKLTVESHAFLEAYSREHGVEIQEQVRNIVHEWAMHQVNVARIADQLLRASGGQGICGERCEGRRK